jgi:xanthine dehydrogenase accessory factor
MDDWLSALALSATPAVLVTVASIQGSSPRETGAKMVVTADRQFDTIGGGHLELRAAEIARDMRAQAPQTLAAQRRLERFPLGPSLGQCCGGVVHLAFERIDAAAYDAIARLRQWRHDRQDSWRLIALDAPLAPLLYARDGTKLCGPAAPDAPAFDLQPPCRVLRDAGGRRWLLDPCLAWRAHLFLFGAGHVGAAVVRALAALPCHVTWVDEREDMFPPQLPPNVRIEVTDTPQVLVDAAAPGSNFLVMTHSHALDQQLAEHILRRGDAGWFGLIGSQTKRMQFEHRLCERGIGAERLASMVCPIGVPGIQGKAPPVIAAAVAAQLLQVWETQQQTADSSGTLRLAARA